MVILFKCNTAGFLYIDPFICLQHRIFDQDIFYMHFRDTSYKNPFGCTIAGDIREIKIPELRRAFIHRFGFYFWRFSFFACQYYRDL